MVHLQKMETAPARDEPDSVDTAAPGLMSAGRWYVLAILTAIYTTHAMDRNLLSIVLEPIKREFGLSDTATGALSGTVYAISFALAGIPLGMLVDRVSRRNLLAIAVALWSAVTALMGLATGYPMLLTLRIALGAAECLFLPAAIALIDGPALSIPVFLLTERPDNDPPTLADEPKENHR